MSTELTVVEASVPPQAASQDVGASWFDQSISKVRSALIEFLMETALVVGVTVVVVYIGVIFSLALCAVCLVFGWPLWAFSSWSLVTRIAVFLLWRYTLLSLLTALRVTVIRVRTGSWPAPDPLAPPQNVEAATPLSWKARVFCCIQAVNYELLLERRACNFMMVAAGFGTATPIVWGAWLCFIFGWPVWALVFLPLSFRIVLAVLWGITWLSLIAALKARGHKKREGC